MAQTKLGILIETLYKGKGAQDAAKDLKDLDKTAKSSTSTLDKARGALGGIAIAAGTVGAAIYTAKKAFDFGAEGAQIIKVRDTFDALTASIGETADMVLGKLRQATAGMVADTELMSSANRFLSMGLAETGDQAAELSRIAVTLGSAMGKDATAAMEEWALLLSNQSIPRLDTFGISAAKVRQRIDELTSANAGMSRETAFMTAVMEEAQISMGKLGDSVPVDPFTEFEVQTKNLTDSLKILAAEALGPVVAGVNDFIQAVTTTSDAVNEQADEITSGVRSYKEARVAVMQMSDAYDIASGAVGRIAGAERDFRGKLTQSFRVLAAYSGSFEEFKQAVEDAGYSSRQFERITGDNIHAFYRLEGAAYAAEKRLRDHITTGQQVADAYQELYGKTNDLIDTQKNHMTTSQQVADAYNRLYTPAVLAAKAAGEELRAENERNAGMFDTLTGAMGTSIDSVRNWTDEMIDAQLQEIAMREKLDELYAKVQDGELTWYEAIQQARDYASALGYIGDAIAMMPDHKRIEIELVFTGNAPDDLLHRGAGGDETVNPNPTRPAPRGGGGGSAGPPGSAAPPGFAHGGDFMVPPGGPFPMIVHPGERVQVTPANQAGKAGATYSVNFNAPVYGEAAMTKALDEFFRQKGVRAESIARRR